MAQITIQLSAQTLQRLTEEANHRKIQLAEMARTAIEEYFAKMDEKQKTGENMPPEKPA
jgi:hypothetical protein